MKTIGGEKESERGYNISNYPVDEIIEIDLNQDINGKKYLMFLEELNANCSRGGAIHAPNIITTFDDDEHPGTMVLVKGMWKYCDVTTYFLVRKADLYLCSHCHQSNFAIGANWINIKGSLVKIKDGKTTTFVVNYDDTSITLDNEYKFLLDRVGKEVILCGLWCLKYGKNVDEQKAGYDAIAHNLCEPARLTKISNILCSAMDGRVTQSLGKYKELFKKWAKLSKLLRRCHVWDGDNKPFSLESSLKPYHHLGIRNYDELVGSLKIVLRENERKRCIRRLKVVQQAEPFVLHYYERSRSSIFKRIHKWKPQWRNNEKSTKNNLSDLRETEILRRIQSGGDPGIWRSIHKSIMEPDKRFAKLIIEHTDINVIRHDLRLSVDDTGEIYRFNKRYMFCDPSDGFF